jgi:O-antigen/teichoic acid export membrane protein
MGNNESALIRFIKSSGVFFIGSVLSKAISILMLPFYTNCIPTGDMGYYDLSLTYITIATSFLFFDIWVAILRYMYDGNTKSEKATAIKSGFSIFAVSSTGYLILGLIFAWIFNPDAIFLILLYGLFQNIANLLCFCVRGFQKNRAFAISGVISAGVNALVNIILILGFGIGYESLYIAAIVGFVAQSFYLLLSGGIFSSLKLGRYDRAITRSMFIYSLPLCLNSIAYWVLTSLNRIVLNGVYGNEANGIYAIGNKFSFVIGLITTCFTFAWQDLSFSKANEQGVGIFYSRASVMYSKFLLLCTALVLPAIKIAFPILVGRAYSSAENTIPLFLVVAAVSAISTFIGNIFYAIKETRMIFISMVVSALVNASLCYPLITRFHINGANLSVLISFIVNILVRWIVLRKKISFQLDKSIAFMFLPLGISFAVFMTLDWKMNAIAFLGVLVFSLYYLRLMHKSFCSKNQVTGGQCHD